MTSTHLDLSCWKQFWPFTTNTSLCWGNTRFETENNYLRALRGLLKCVCLCLLSSPDDPLQYREPLCTLMGSSPGPGLQTPEYRFVACVCIQILGVTPTKHRRRGKPSSCSSLSFSFIRIETSLQRNFSDEMIRGWKHRQHRTWLSVQIKIKLLL